MTTHVHRAAQIAMTGLLLVITVPAAAPAAAAPTLATAPAKGVLRVRSMYAFDDTVTRIKADIAAKRIEFFDEIDQSQLGAGANIALRPSKLLLFGNPPLGVQFLQSNRYAGLDWPVRMLVTEEADGSVWLAWSDFTWVARRYAIKDKDVQFKMATGVAAGLAAEAAK